jgi:adenine-specific DNA-methyltransferase
MIYFGFFAGSGTTGMLFLNKIRKISRKSIIVQLPEYYNNRERKPHTFLYKNNLSQTISELTKESLRRAGKKFVKIIQTGMVMLVFVF